MGARASITTGGFRHLYPFRSHFHRVRGWSYHYLDEGRGSPIVMLHGNPTWSFYFRHLVTALSPEYRIIVPDHLGCGLSDKPGAAEYGFRLKDRVGDLESLLDHLSLTRDITLLVHDWGGMIGMVYATRHPERIRRIIITNTAAFPPPAGKTLPLRLQITRNLKVFAVPAILGFNLFARAAIYMAPARRLASDVALALIAPYDRPANRLATLKFVQDIPIAPRDPSYELVRQTGLRLHHLGGIPMLICWGKQDFVFDMDYLREWRRRFPDAETHVFPNGGHYLLEDNPLEIGRIVKAFLKKHPL